MFNNIKVLLGGGSGLCGSHLSRFLLDKGYSVVILDDFSESFPENLDPRAKFYLVDIGDFKKVQQIFDIEKPDYVYGMQAHASEILSHWMRVDCYKNNLLTEMSLINASINSGVKKVIAFSSMAIYGEKNPPFTEDMEASPLDPYGISKANLEADHELAKNHFGLDYSVVRPHNFQGVFVNWMNIYRNFVGIAVRKSLNNENILVYGDGLQTRAVSDVKYLCDPLEKLLYTDLKVVNVGADKPYTILSIAQIIQKIANQDGKNISIEHREPRHEVKHAFCNHKIAKEKLGFKDETDIEKLCYEIYHWAKTQPKRDLKWSDYEVNKNIYSYWKHE